MLLGTSYLSFSRLGRRAALAAAAAHPGPLTLLHPRPLPHGAKSRCAFTTAPPPSPSRPPRVATAPPLAMKPSAAANGGGSAAAATPPDADLLAKATRIRGQLDALYPDPAIPLEHRSPFQLLVAVMLSAQTTDKKVNEVTPALFDLAPDAPAMAAAPVSAIQTIIQPIGLAPTKAKNLQAAATMLVERHDGQVPSTFEELEALPGVGHKTASVVMAQAFGLPAFPVDTHIHRLAQRWGLTRGNGAGTPTVEATERDLKALWPPEAWHDLHLQIIYFGREHCPAQRHDPTGCPICSWAAVPPYDQPGASPAKAAGNKAPGGAKAAAAAAAKASKGEASRAAAAIAAAAAEPPAVAGAKAPAKKGRGAKRGTGAAGEAELAPAGEEGEQLGANTKAAAGAARGRKRRAPQVAASEAATIPAEADSAPAAEAAPQKVKRGRRVAAAADAAAAPAVDTAPASDQGAGAKRAAAATRKRAAPRGAAATATATAVDSAAPAGEEEGGTAKRPRRGAAANGGAAPAAAAPTAAGGRGAVGSLDTTPAGLVGNVFATFRSVISSFSRR